MATFEQFIKNKILLERSEGLFRYIQQQLPNTPNYILKDVFWVKVKNIADFQMLKEFINFFKSVKWTLKHNVEISLDKFNKDTIRRINMRKSGDENPLKVPRDKERHETQQKLIVQRGISTEPIICMWDENENKLELLEGWHRTIQNLKQYPNGFIYPNVYIGYK